MREIYKPYSLKGKKQTKTTTILVALLVAATFILGSAVPAFATKANTTKLNEIETKLTGDLTGLDPNFVYQAEPSLTKELSRGAAPISPLADTMYGYIAYSAGSGHPEGPCYWPLDDPGTIESLGSTSSGNFIAGGTWTCDERWLGCEYGSGILWEFDPETGDMWDIGGGGMGCHGLAWDPVYNRLYGTTGSSLVEYDPDTGEQDVIGSHGIGQTLIALAINLDGECFAWDVKFSGNAILYSVDLATGEAEDIADMGENLLYAQDGAFDWDTGILWLSAYSSTGFLAYWDFDAEELVHIDNFQGGAEITASMIMAPCIPPEHDVGIKSIDSPSSGPCVDDMPMLVTVKNSGNNTETFNAQMEVIKCEAGPLVMDEDFSGDTFPPEGWETDYWKKSYTNRAGGESPEARCYKYDRTQNYDNYIMTPAIDCTGLEKVNLRFRWAADVQYTNWCSVYVKFRRNSTSNWKDVTPWDNPLSSDMDPDLYEIGCYGFGEPMGEEFQIKWEYLGYYYYFNYWWLDDVSLEACGGCAEYAELIQYITLDVGEEMQLEFPGWTPSEWHNESTENTWEEYPIHAWIILEGDQQPRNNEKWKLVDLWYPWLYDISLSSIDSPHDPEERWLPGQEFEVKATMFNAGQYEMCCIPIELSIGEPIVLDTLLEQYDWPGSYYNPGQTDGWYDEHKEIVYYYGWRRSYSSNSGGDPYEAYIPYYYARADTYFYSPAIDASAVSGLRLEFLSYINHWAGQGLYTLEAGYSFDKETWYAAWSEAPGSSGGYEVSVPIEGGAPEIYIGFWVKGNPYYFNYWYVDNVRLVETGLIEEFSDNACQGPDIEPGEYVTFQFDDWTPEHLATEETADIEYITQAFIFAEGDRNPGNDLLQEGLLLKYWHDAGIDAITSPGYSEWAPGGLWNNGEPDGRNGLAGGMYYGYNNQIADDFENENKWVVNEGTLHYVWNSGYTDNMAEVKVYFYEEVDDCEPSETAYATRTATWFNEYETGETYFGRPGMACDIMFDDVILPPGRWWVSMVPEGTYQNICYILTAEGQDCELMAWLEYWGYNTWYSSSYMWGQSYDAAYLLNGVELGAPPIDTYIQPGTETLTAIAENYGTFPERGLTCSGVVKDYIIDPENGTEIHSASDGPFDLMTPLGGTRTLNLGSCIFADEGRYGFYLDMPSADDFIDNSVMRFGVAVDDTAPVTGYTLNPAVPDGLNDWYVSDLEITLTASDPDPTGKNCNSGVKEIRYSINGVEGDPLPGSSGTFVLTEDGQGINVKYWAIDNVGNAEVKKEIPPINMDQTAPATTADDFTYEIVDGNQYQGWDILFTVNATDAMSDMDRVEFYLNDVLQETVLGTGPTYTWEFTYWFNLHVFIKAVAYDVAGNSIFFVIEDPETTNVPRQHSNNNTPRGRPHPR
jgi:hypothetical protein